MGLMIRSRLKTGVEAICETSYICDARQTMEKPHAPQLMFYRRFLIFSLQSRDSVFGITTGYWLDDRGLGVRVPVG
jgi:hypothetical protein